MNDLVENVKISGEVYLDNLNIYEKCDIVGLRKRVGMVFQKQILFPCLYMIILHMDLEYMELNQD